MPFGATINRLVVCNLLCSGHVHFDQVTVELICNRYFHMYYLQNDLYKIWILQSMTLNAFCLAY